RQRLPALPAILRALDRSGAADRPVAGGDEKHLGVIGFQRQAAAVGEPEMLADTPTAPALAAVGAGEDLARRAGEHCALAIGNDRGVVDIGVIEPARDAGPAL